MGKIAFVFPGQGAQFSGMGKSLFDNSPVAKDAFLRMDAVRAGTSAQCFHGEDGELSQTKNTQPCLFACELASAMTLAEAGIKADYLAGFSLGEVAALSFSGAVTLEDGMVLVTKRGELMDADAKKVDSAMLAVVKLPNETVEEICATFSATFPVNYNSPDQITVACIRDEMEAFSTAVRQHGGRALPLKVSGGFHSIFMADAAKAFGEELTKYTITPPKTPLYANLTGDVYGENIAQTLSAQICHPVRWETIVRNLIAQGVDTFIEVGPGKVLSGLIKKIDATVRCFEAGEFSQCEAIIKELKPC